MHKSRFEARTRRKERKGAITGGRKGDEEEERVLGKNFCLYAQSGI